MSKRLSLEQITQNMFNGIPIEDKLRLKLPLNRDEQWLYDRMPYVSNDELRLALLDRGPGFAPLALETGGHFVDGGGNRVGEASPYLSMIRRLHSVTGLKKQSMVFSLEQ